MATEPKREDDTLFQRALRLLGGETIGEPVIRDQAGLEQAIARGLNDDALFHLVSCAPMLRHERSLERVLSGADQETIIVNGRLSENDGWRLWRLAQLVCKACKVLGDLEAGCGWLQRCPLDAAGLPCSGLRIN